MDQLTQISESDFFYKILGICIAWIFYLIYISLRSLLSGKRYMMAGMSSEQDLLNKRDFSIRDLQQGPWLINTEKTINYASISLSTLILAAVFIFEQKLTGYDALMFDFIIAIFTLSTLAYFLGLQLWFLALDLGGSEYSRIRFRRIATIFQTVGWLSLQCAGMSAVMAVNTYIGYAVSFLGIIALIFMIEYKSKVLKDDLYFLAECNEFQKKIEERGIFVKEGRDLVPREESNNDHIRILTWNIERGYHPDILADYILELNPDIVCLQEVDWGNERTEKRDVLLYLAERTGMRGFFSSEFIEIQTPYRTKRTAGGGIHGNAFLTKISFSNVYRVELPEIFNWEYPPRSGRNIVKFEKRLGVRFALCADFTFLGINYSICSTHFEDKGGDVNGRRKQLEELISQWQQIHPASLKIITGDLNTSANRLTRFIRYTTAPKSMPRNMSECEWWKFNILPPLSLKDPFSCDAWTFNLGGIYKEKLDWIILDTKIQVLSSGMGEFNSSDHRPLWVDIYT